MPYLRPGTKSTVKLTYLLASPTPIFRLVYNLFIFEGLKARDMFTLIASATGKSLDEWEISCLSAIDPPLTRSAPTRWATSA